ncbi:MAG: hypothetical protein ACR2JC_14125 [Chloroflexota bacterium]|nr:MAG: hypothetical protein DLM70_18645 [Chloroflexota bacterium]
MKRFGLVVWMAAMLALLPLAVPHVALADGDDGTYHLAAGRGESAFGGFAFSVHCRTTGPAICTKSGATGSNGIPYGDVAKGYADPSTGKTDIVSGEPTCLAVAPPNAWITWRVLTVRCQDDPGGRRSRVKMRVQRRGVERRLLQRFHSGNTSRRDRSGLSG